MLNFTSELKNISKLQLIEASANNGYLDTTILTVGNILEKNPQIKYKRKKKKRSISLFIYKIGFIAK